MTTRTLSAYTQTTREEALDKCHLLQRLVTGGGAGCDYVGLNWTGLANERATCRGTGLSHTQNPFSGTLGFYGYWLVALTGVSGPRNAVALERGGEGRGDPQLVLSSLSIIVIGRVSSSLFSRYRLACESNSTLRRPQERRCSLCPERLVLSVPVSPGTPCSWLENPPLCASQVGWWVVGGGLTRCLSPFVSGSHPALACSAVIQPQLQTTMSTIEWDEHYVANSRRPAEQGTTGHARPWYSMGSDAM